MGGLVLPSKEPHWYRKAAASALGPPGLLARRMDPALLKVKIIVPSRVPGPGKPKPPLTTRLSLMNGQERPVFGEAVVELSTVVVSKPTRSCATKRISG